MNHHLSLAERALEDALRDADDAAHAHRQAKSDERTHLALWLKFQSAQAWARDCHAAYEVAAFYDFAIDLDEEIPYLHDAKQLERIARRLKPGTARVGDRLDVVDVNDKRSPVVAKRVTVTAITIELEDGKTAVFKYHDEYMAPGFRRTGRDGYYEFLEPAGVLRRWAV